MKGTSSVGTTPAKTPAVGATPAKTTTEVKEESLGRNFVRRGVDAVLDTTAEAGKTVWDVTKGAVNTVYDVGETAVKGFGGIFTDAFWGTARTANTAALGYSEIIVSPFSPKEADIIKERRKEVIDISKKMQKGEL